MIDRRKFLGTAGAAAAGLSLVGSAGRAEATTEKIKIGQIGTGHAHASSVFRQLLEVSDEYEIVGIVESDPVRQKSLGDAYRGVRLMSEEQLLETEGLQAVVIETEVEQLLPTARRCAEAGVNIHLDKPAGEDLKAFAQLIDLVRRKGLHLQMGYIYRYDPAFQLCYQAVADGWLGDVFELHGVMSKKVDADSRKYLSRFAGGAMFEIGCHLIDAMVRVLGKPSETTAFTRQTHPDRDALVDNQLAVFEYPRATASIRSSLIEYEGFRRRQFTVCGEFGTFDLRPLGGRSFRLALERPRGEYRTGYQDVALPPAPGIFVSAFRDMAAILRGEKETDYTLEHELAVHEAILRASGYRLDEPSGPVAPPQS